MFQDIDPHTLDISYTPRQAQIGDYLIFIQDDNVLVVNNDTQTIPQYGIEPFENIDNENSMQYLLSVNDISFFYMSSDYEIPEKTMWQRNSIFRTIEPAWIAFGVATAFHLGTWYDTHRYCGRCKTPLEQLTIERALGCPACTVIEYPKICPVIIAGVTDGDWLLLTKYATGEYQRYALVAGFAEIGETFEDTVRREVMEEVGLEVHNIQYYKSQPWAFSQSLLAGFFVEADKSKKISIDSGELKEAVWCHREELPHDDDTAFSLTWDMIEAFRRGWKPT
jgi:NAD+ diphosphatase